MKLKTTLWRILLFLPILLSYSVVIFLIFISKDTHTYDSIVEKFLWLDDVNDFIKRKCGL